MSTMRCRLALFVWLALPGIVTMVASARAATLTASDGGFRIFAVSTQQTILLDGTGVPFTGAISPSPASFRITPAPTPGLVSPFGGGVGVADRVDLFAPFATVGHGGHTGTFVTTPANPFNPFPFAGATTPLLATGGTFMDPFPFLGAAAPFTTGGLPVEAHFGTTAPRFPQNGHAPVTTVTTTIETMLTSPALSASPAPTSAVTGSSAPAIVSPEPSSWLLMVSGLGWLIWANRKRLQATHVFRS